MSSGRHAPRAKSARAASTARSDEHSPSAAMRREAMPVFFAIFSTPQSGNSRASSALVSSRPGRWYAMSRMAACMSLFPS